MHKEGSGTDYYLRLKVHIIYIEDAYDAYFEKWNMQEEGRQGSVRVSSRYSMEYLILKKMVIRVPILCNIAEMKSTIERELRNLYPEEDERKVEFVRDKDNNDLTEGLIVSEVFSDGDIAKIILRDDKDTLQRKLQNLRKKRSATDTERYYPQSEHIHFPGYRPPPKKEKVLQEAVKGKVSDNKKVDVTQKIETPHVEGTPGVSMSPIPLTPKDAKSSDEFKEEIHHRQESASREEKIDVHPEGSGNRHPPVPDTQVNVIEKPAKPQAKNPATKGRRQDAKNKDKGSETPKPVVPKIVAQKSAIPPDENVTCDEDEDLLLSGTPDHKSHFIPTLRSMKIERPSNKKNK